MFDFSQIPDIKPRSVSRIRCTSTAKLRSQNDSLQKLRQFIRASPKHTKHKFSDIRKHLTQNAQHLQNRHIKQQKVLRNDVKQIQGVPYAQIKDVNNDKRLNIISRTKQRQASESRDKSQSKVKLFGQLIKAQRDSSARNRVQRKMLVKIEDKQNRNENQVRRRPSRNKSRQSDPLIIQKQLQPRLFSSPIRVDHTYVIECKKQISCVKQQCKKPERPESFKDLIKYHNMRSFGNLGKCENIRF